MQPDVDLVVVFRASSKTFSKQQARDDAHQAENQYSRLIHTLHDAGLKAVGRRGERQGQLIVLLNCSDDQLKHLVRRERHSDFLHGLTTSSLPSIARDLDVRSLSPAERLRLVYEYVTSMPLDGGLGVSPLSSEWNRVESVMALHDPEFNEVWIRSLTRHRVGLDHLDTIRSQFGEAVAFYFCFLISYTRFLMMISLAGFGCFLFGHAYSVIYSSVLFLWSVVFVEWWRVRERVFAVRWGTQGSFRVERRRPQFIEGIPWWKRELRMLASVPVMLVFAGILFALLTGIFVFEAFVTTLYTGPGHEYISFIPTVLFIAVIPSFLAIYQSRACALTKWENHRHQSSYDASLTIKTFSLSAMVAYLGLALSAFVYVPFGEPMMQYVQQRLFLGGDALSSLVESEKAQAGKALFETNASAGKNKLDRSRLQSQMFAYTVTNQVINTFTEIGLPFILRAVDSVRLGHGLGGILGKRRASFGTTPAKKKRVGFEDEKNGAREEREFLERVRREVALPAYDLFTDYSEMVTQFGYVALWSTIWPLAPGEFPILIFSITNHLVDGFPFLAVMSYINNMFELRSDAFKIVTHARRPLPTRVDTIGPWLDCLSFLAWLSAITNSSLVYLFRPAHDGNPLSTVFEREHNITATVVSSGFPDARTRNLFVTALLLALGASHGYIIVRAAARHILERIVWKGSAEEARAESTMKEVKEEYFKSVEADAGLEKARTRDVDEAKDEKEQMFWTYDEGLEEIWKVVKEP
ncbi:hypothetical protein EW146_g3059 [Bondarzewia mesenterica]|uniref:DUF590-domain-containing protein n=1 Tax=Bondarzewia mesenterica TaxID=1095465 RepID=A0A4S4LYW4_9AGAM|nr:hypothetical protein EW146_g3059 [Bondarzewia mesenterica]